MATVELIGFAAAFCTTAAFFPHVLRVMKTKSTHDISLGMFLLMTVGTFLWLIYGVQIDSKPVMVANLISFALAFIILIYKLKYK